MAINGSENKDPVRTKTSITWLLLTSPGTCHTSLQDFPEADTGTKLLYIRLEINTGICERKRVESSIEPKKKSNFSVCPRKPQLSQWEAPAWVLPIRVVKPLAFISFLAWPWFKGMNSGKVDLCSSDRSWRSWQLGKVLPWRGVIDSPPIIPILQPYLDFSTFSKLTEHFPTS